jgi:hypothetical protein
MMVQKGSVRAAWQAVATACVVIIVFGKLA